MNVARVYGHYHSHFPPRDFWRSNNNNIIEFISKLYFHLVLRITLLPKKLLLLLKSCGMKSRVGNENETGNNAMKEI